MPTFLRGRGRPPASVAGPVPARPAARLPRLLPLAVVLAAVGATPVHAGPSDALHVYAGLGYFHDDNLFRLPDDAPGYDNQRGDSARTGEFGLFFDKTYSRQKVFLQAKRSKVKFDHFKQLDYDGKDYLGRLNWEIGNHLSGSVGASYTQMLAPYTDLRSRERNLRVQKREFFDGAWRLHPSWQLRAGATRDKYTYELSAQRINDRIEDAYEAGVDYLPKSGSSVGLQARHIKGDYLNNRVINGIALNENYTQDELKAKVDWHVTQISSVQVLAGYAKRKHEGQGSARDTSGFNGRVTVNSQPRVKLHLNAAAWREFTPVESNIVTYALSRGASAGATWDATAKIRVDAAVTRERRSFESRLVLSAADLSDTISRTTLNATWSPRPTIQVSTGLAHESRTGSILGSGSYKANTLSLNANAQF